MGRKRTSNLGLPVGMRIVKRGDKTYYYLEVGRSDAGKRKLKSLGQDYIGALREYADLMQTCSGPVVTVPELLNKWNMATCTSRTPGTRKDINWAIPNLVTFFANPAPAPLDAVQPQHIAQYLDWRAKTAPVRANREVAWLSAAWNWGRERGITDRANPCAGVRRNKESGRDIYVEDDEMAAIMAHADEPLRYAIMLAYLTGQRPGDMRRMDESDIRDGHLLVQQAKTGAKLRIGVVGELAELIESIKEFKRRVGATSVALLVDERGYSMGRSQMIGRFRKARAKAAQAAGENSKLVAKIMQAQMRDFRAKAATDKREAAGLDGAQRLLGHSTQEMTEHYTRQRKGTSVSPVK